MGCIEGTLNSVFAPVKTFMDDVVSAKHERKTEIQQFRIISLALRVGGVVSGIFALVIIPHVIAALVTGSAGALVFGGLFLTLFGAAAHDFTKTSSNVMRIVAQAHQDNCDLKDAFQHIWGAHAANASDAQDLLHIVENTILLRPIIQLFT